MIGMTRGERIGIPIGLALFVILGGTYVSGQLVALIICGSPFKDASVLSGVQLAFSNNVATAYGTIDGCTVEATPIWVAFAVLVIVLAALTIWVILLVLRYRQSDVYFRKELLSRKGFAQYSELRKTVSEKAMLKRAKTLRPSLKTAKPSDVSWRVGSSRGIDVRISTEQSVVLWGPPRSGKGLRIVIGAIVDAIGSLVTTSTRGDNIAATYSIRKKAGPVVVFDPQGISGIRSAMKWSPIRGAEDPEIATRRAKSILAGDPSSKGGNAEWANASSIIAAGLLHAAAVSGKGISDLRSWTSNAGMAKAAQSILEVDGTPGWAGRLGGVLDADPRLLDSNWHSLRSAFDPLFLPKISEAMSPGDGEDFSAREFLQNNGSLYLLGTGAAVGAVGGFLAAMMNDLVEEARRMAMSSPGQRFDPGLALILDELFNLFAWPELPVVMSDGGGSGISTMVVQQSLSQPRTVLGDTQADTIWASANVKLLLGGAGDTDDLRSFSDLLGPRYVKRTSESLSEQGLSWNQNETQQPLISIDELRRLPDGLGVMTGKNGRPILLDVGRWVDRKDGDEIGSAKRATEAEQQQVLKEMYGGENV